jgi:hypothetical protein
MTVILICLIVALVVALATLGARHMQLTQRHAPEPPAGETRRILFPFVASALSVRALDATLRLARAEDATLMPVFLARVPMTMPLDAPLPRQAGIAIPLQEAIEQRAARFAVPVDARIERGRTHRHALRQAIANERHERIVIAAATEGHPGFHPDDVAWLLATAPGEIVVLRPGSEDPLLPLAAAAPPAARRGAGRRRAAGDRRPVELAR